MNSINKLTVKVRIPKSRVLELVLPIKDICSTLLLTLNS